MMLPVRKSFLSGFKGHLEGQCVGSISEIFDAEPPFTPRGCCAQAWSVAEVLRSFVKTANGGEGIDETKKAEISREAVLSLCG